MTTTTEVLVPTMEKAAATADRAVEKAAKMANARSERTSDLGKTAATTQSTTITDRKAESRYEVGGSLDDAFMDHLLTNIVIPESASRQNVIPEDRETMRSITLGLSGP